MMESLQCSINLPTPVLQQYLAKELAKPQNHLLLGQPKDIAIHSLTSRTLLEVRDCIPHAIIVPLLVEEYPRGFIFDQLKDLAILTLPLLGIHLISCLHHHLV